MKKVIYWAAVLLAAACQKEALAPSLEGDTNVSFTIEIPVSEQTKATTVAMSTAAQTDIVYYEIWDSQWNKKLTKEVRSAEVKNRLASVDLKLVSGQTYNFVVWAQIKDCGAYDATDLQRVKIFFQHAAFHLLEQIKAVLVVLIEGCAAYIGFFAHFLNGKRIHGLFRKQTQQCIAQSLPGVNNAGVRFHKLLLVQKYRLYSIAHFYSISKRLSVTE